MGVFASKEGQPQIAGTVCSGVYGEFMGGAAGSEKRQLEEARESGEIEAVKQTRTKKRKTQTTRFKENESRWENTTGNICKGKTKISRNPSLPLGDLSNILPPSNDGLTRQISLRKIDKVLDSARIEATETVAKPPSGVVGQILPDLSKRKTPLSWVAKDDEAVMEVMALLRADDSNETKEGGSQLWTEGGGETSVSTEAVEQASIMSLVDVSIDSVIGGSALQGCESLNMIGYSQVDDWSASICAEVQESTCGATGTTESKTESSCESDRRERREVETGKYIREKAEMCPQAVMPFADAVSFFAKKGLNLNPYTSGVINTYREKLVPKENILAGCTDAQLGRACHTVRVRMVSCVRTEAKPDLVCCNCCVRISARDCIHGCCKQCCTVSYGPGCSRHSKSKI
uniref:Uncharacterized protein n=1 Tax=Mucochytrium quahogii TaxID=96639 RepID=A0A7S2RIL0_9STRA